MLGAMFPLPRVLYAMASDGVIFKFLSTVHPKTHTPLLATMIAGLLTGRYFIFNFKFLHYSRIVLRSDILIHVHRSQTVELAYMC